MERFLRGYETVLLAGDDIRISDVTRLAAFSAPVTHSAPARDRTPEKAPEADDFAGRGIGTRDKKAIDKRLTTRYTSTELQAIVLS